MSRKKLLIILGVLVLLSPFLGLPYSFLYILLPLLGAAVIVAALFRRPAPKMPASHAEPPAL